MGTTSLKGMTGPSYVNWTPVKYNTFDVGDLRPWLRKHCEGHVTIGAAYLYFELNTDAVIFKLAK